MAAISDPPAVVTKSAGWAGGVNLRDALPQITADEAKVMENGVLDQRGAFGKRLGCMFRGTFGAGEQALSLYTYYRYPNPPQMLLNTTAGKLYYTNDPFADPVTWVEFATGLSTTKAFSYETFNGSVYMGNGVNDFRKWSGVAQTLFASAPKCAYVRLWKDTLHMTGNDATPDRIYQSAPGDAESWPVSGWIDIGRGDGDRTTGLGTDGQSLIVFKRNRHWSIYDPVTLANRIVDFEKGCESHFSILEFEGEILFLSRRGICRYFGDAPSQIISSKVDPLFDHEVINFDALGKVTGYVIDNQVGWAIPEVGNTEPTFQLEYYPRLAALTEAGRGAGPFVFHRMPVGVFAHIRKADNDHLYGAKLGTNRFLELFSTDSGFDDSLPFVATLETGAFEMGQPTRTKYIRRFRFYGRGQVQASLLRNLSERTYKAFTLTLGSVIDLWDPTHKWNEGTWGPDEILKETIINPDAYGRYFQLRFVDSMTTVGQKELDVGSKEYTLTAGGWALHQYTIDANILGVRD